MENSFQDSRPQFRAHGDTNVCYFRRDSLSYSDTSVHQTAWLLCGRNVKCIHRWQKIAIFLIAICLFWNLTLILVWTWLYDRQVAILICANLISSLIALSKRIRRPEKKNCSSKKITELLSWNNQIPFLNCFKRKHIKAMESSIRESVFFAFPDAK